MSNKQKYTLTVINGRVKVYIDGLVMVTFDQLNFEGYYAFKSDSSLYGIDFYLKDTTIETSYKLKETWVEILKLLDSKL